MLKKLLLDIYPVYPGTDGLITGLLFCSEVSHISS